MCRRGLVTDLVTDLVTTIRAIITTIARRGRSRFFTVRVIRASLRPSFIDSGRTITLGRRATLTTRTQPAGSLVESTTEINDPVNVAGRA